MEYNGEAVADSQLCIEYLKKKRNLDMDSHLTDEQRGIARAFLKLTEENLYWLVWLFQLNSICLVIIILNMWVC